MNELENLIANYSIGKKNENKRFIIENCAQFSIINSELKTDNNINHLVQKVTNLTS